MSDNTEIRLLKKEVAKRRGQTEILNKRVDRLVKSAPKSIRPKSGENQSGDSPEGET